MDFGILTEACMIGTDTSFRDRYHEVLAEARLADEVGFDVWGASEQHFSAPLCSISAGELMLAAAASTTKRIKLRTCITLLPFHQPVRVAEQIATLDLISDGRIEFGSGRGNSAVTAGGFNIELSETEKRWEEGMEVLIRAWTQDEFSYDGQFYKVPPRRLSPKLIQEPHPKLWFAAISPESHKRAARKGMGVMSLSVGVTLKQLQKRIEIYNDAAVSPEPYAGVVNKRFSVYALANCADTNEQARADARAPMLAYLKGVVDLYENTMKSSGASLDFTETRRTISDFDHLDRSDNVIVGDPETVIRKIKRYESMGVEEMMFRIEGMPHHAAMRAIELIGKHVIPAFKKH